MEDKKEVDVEIEKSKAERRLESIKFIKKDSGDTQRFSDEELKVALNIISDLDGFTVAVR